MALVKLTEKDIQGIIHLRYGTKNNVTNEVIYQNPVLYLHEEAAEKMIVAADYARRAGYQVKVWDAYRPPEGQQALWDACPDATFVTPPEKGSPHSRGIAVDLTLCDLEGEELDMGTDFDDFRELAYHTHRFKDPIIHRNRQMLAGIMALAGWDNYLNEWWHYQLFKPKEYPVIADGTEGAEKMMEKPAEIL